MLSNRIAQTTCYRFVEKARDHLQKFAVVFDSLDI